MGLSSLGTRNLLPNVTTLFNQLLSVYENYTLFGLYGQNVPFANGAPGEITLGGSNPERYSGNLIEVPNVSTQGLWTAAVVKAQVMTYSGRRCCQLSEDELSRKDRPNCR